MKQEEKIMEEISEVRKTTGLEKHLQTIMLSIVTITIVGGFSKISNMSEAMVRMEERDRSKSEQISSMTMVMNKMQLDLIDVKDRMTKMEANQKVNNHNYGRDN